MARSDRDSRVSTAAREESRIKEMQDCVLDAADISIDRQPVRPPRVNGARSHAVGRSARNTRTIRRTYRACRFRVAPACRKRGRRHVSRSDDGRADCPAGRSASSGNSTGKSVLRDRHDAAVRNGLSGSGSPSNAGAKPANRAGGNGPWRVPLPALPALRSPRLPLDIQTVEEARIGELSRAGIGLVADGKVRRRRREPLQARPADRICARNRDRAGHAPEPKMAPVP